MFPRAVPGAQPASSGRSAPSLTSVSASSAAGSLSAMVADAIDAQAKPKDAKAD